jgi:hypothetical protein
MMESILYVVDCFEHSREPIMKDGEFIARLGYCRGHAVA